jgi:hypothetical protein
MDGEATVASVVGDTGVIGDDDVAPVDEGDAVYINAVDGGVVVEVIPCPITTVIAETGIAEAIVDAAVEADVRAPVAVVEAIVPRVEVPVAGRPKGSIVRSGAPDARNPVVAGWCKAPVARSPDVVGSGRFGLIVRRQCRRRLGGLFVECSLAGVDLIFVVGVVGCGAVGVLLVSGRGVLIGLLALILRLAARRRSGAIDGCATGRGLELLLLILRLLGLLIRELILRLTTVAGRQIRVGGIRAGIVCLLGRSDRAG